MSTMPLPSDRRTIDDLLAKARTQNRYTDYDIAAAEARLRSRQAARHRPPRHRTTPTPHTTWTAPEDDRTPDADRAWWDLNAVSLLILFGPDADRHLADFIKSQYADKTGALVFACLPHLADDSNGARFWWRFAAGADHHVAEYRLYLEHAHSGEYDDADHWRTQLLRHHFEPTTLCGDRTTAPPPHPRTHRRRPPPHHPPAPPRNRHRPPPPTTPRPATTPPHLPALNPETTPRDGGTRPPPTPQPPLHPRPSATTHGTTTAERHRRRCDIEDVSSRIIL
ncbi:hypothetical protein [Streptomyces sporangiiformans]|uniref:Uncharacterized protein n=1 Tax=Streptomyces sporangiiformans TaxID=2315329 RepID=A0A505DES5_9ACTN|nr:hypothetical protein [Streptomyces sporangiiformans]TPQ21367.1 hypothetical protein FGD71_015590 [Streptomyces sporangiiformans]